MAFHPLTARSTRGEGRAVHPPERLQEDMLMAVSSYFLQRYWGYLTAPVNVQCSGHANVLRHEQQEVWINDSNDLPINTIWKRHSRCRHLQHHPLPYTEGQRRYQVPPVTQTGSNSSNTPEKEKICVSMVVSAPQPSANSQTRMWWLSLKITIF